MNFPFFRRTIPAGRFERSVFAVVGRQIADKKAFSEELAAAANLEEIPVTESVRRQKKAAELYLLLERNISQEQVKNRIPPEVLREKIFHQCHPDRAEGHFALLFLPHYELQIKLFERFADMMFARAKELLEPAEYAEFLAYLETESLFKGTVRSGVVLWKKFERHMENFGPPVRRDMTQNVLKRAFGLLTGKLIKAYGDLRAEVVFKEVYKQFHEPLSFIDSSPKVLLLVPDNFLTDERIALMGKEELEEQLRLKNKALETTLAEVQGEKLKLSTLSREQLETKVQERTAELVNALKAAEAAQKNLEEFSSLATHELRTPIAAVKGYLKLLLTSTREKLDDQDKKFLDQAANANERLLTLVNAMLNVARLELGTLAIDPKPTYIPDIAESILADLMPRIKEKHLNVSTIYDRTVPILDLDPSLMHAILQNLLSNAVKYTPDLGKIRLAVQKRDADVLIGVEDTGYGIPKAQQVRIFEKMFRADNARVKVSEGTGLGLYLVKSILAQAGGTITFESIENEGTTFYVTIPLSGMKKKEGTKGLS